MILFYICARLVSKKYHMVTADQIKEPEMSLKTWMALVGLTLSAFIFNTSEFIPIALLTDIGKDFGLTEAKAGMLISVYAWVVMVLSMPLMLMTSKMEMRKLLLGVVAVFTSFQVMSYLSASFGMLMVSRIGVACAHSIFWSIVSIIAVKIVPDSHRSLALSMIVTGTSIAMILGLPLGRVIGLSLGWRLTFLSIGAVSLFVLLYLFTLLPKVPSGGGMTAHDLPAMFRNKVLIGIFITTAAFATGYYTAYSYIEPFLQQVGRMSESAITMTLMIFGGAGIIGSILFSKYYPKIRYRFINISMIGLIAGVLLLLPVSSSVPITIAVCTLWGMSATAFNVAMQSEIITDTPQSQTSVAMSIFSGIFNFGIGTGALIGGLVCTHMSISFIGIAGGLIVMLALLYWRLVVANRSQQKVTKLS